MMIMLLMNALAKLLNSMLFFILLTTLWFLYKNVWSKNWNQKMKKDEFYKSLSDCYSSKIIEWLEKKNEEFLDEDNCRYMYFH